jgi:hypothetical protein
MIEQILENVLNEHKKLNLKIFSEAPTKRHKQRVLSNVACKNKKAFEL